MRSHLLFKLGSQITRKRSAKTKNKIFTEWLSLYNYFSRFTRSHANHFQNQESQLHYLNKFWRKLKMNRDRRQMKRRNMIRAEFKYFDKHVRVCFGNWAWFVLERRRTVKAAYRAVHATWSEKTKAAYLRALQRAFYLSRQLQRFRTVTLQKKVFASFRRKREFMKLKAQMRSICSQKYEGRLLCKGFDLLLEYSQVKIKMKSLVKVHQLTQQNRLLDKAMKAFRIARSKRMVKLASIQEASSLHTKRLQFKGLFGLQKHRLLRTKLRNLSRRVASKRDQR